MIKKYNDILSNIDMDYILNLEEVKKAKEEIDKKAEGSIYFSIDISPSTQKILFDNLGLNLSNIPARWIKGDTKPHIDKGINNFINTHLIYLTDSKGDILIDKNIYPIKKNTAYIFSEGLEHQTINTDSNPRLLLGPMSEQGFAVGLPTSISANGATDTIYFKYINESSVYYKINNGSYTDFSLPITIINSNTSSILKVLFETDMIINTNIFYFICGSNNIQFGSTSLKNDGTRPIITINITNYDGLIFNGDNGQNGYNNISIYNLIINGIEGSLQIGAGWLGMKYFGKGTTENYIINCSSMGEIKGGGILGDYAENVSLIGCSSNGDIIQPLSGGIVGHSVKSVILKYCWSLGDINEDGCGGIVGAMAKSAEILSCYSEGDIIGNNSGGIIGNNSGEILVQINNCYSKGNITRGNSGGICGSLAPSSGVNNVSIKNCYSTGNVFFSSSYLNGGICGLLFPSDEGTVNIEITNCYTTGTDNNSIGYIIGYRTIINGTNSSPTIQYTLSNNFSEAGSIGGSPGNWSNINANNTLTGTPISNSSIGNIWVNSGQVNQPYELFNIGYIPYTVLIISNNNLVKTHSQTIQRGNSSNPAIKNDPSGNYNILEIIGGDIQSRDIITMNANTGSITVPSSTTPATYTIYLRNTGSYNISYFNLTVISENTGSTPTNSFRVYDLLLVELTNSIYLTKNGGLGPYNSYYTIYNTVLLELLNIALLKDT
jgi:hypothetical protein